MEVPKFILKIIELKIKHLVYKHSLILFLKKVNTESYSVIFFCGYFMCLFNLLRFLKNISLLKFGVVIPSIFPQKIFLLVSRANLFCSIVLKIQISSKLIFSKIFRYLFNVYECFHKVFG